jgi:hypothetical protein
MKPQKKEKKSREKLIIANREFCHILKFLLIKSLKTFSIFIPHKYRVSHLKLLVFNNYVNYSTIMGP